MTITTIPRGFTVRPTRTSSVDEAREDHTPDLGADAPERTLVVGLLQEPRLLAQGSARTDAADHPLGTGRLKRSSTSMGPMRQVRSQGCRAAASGLGRPTDRVFAVSYGTLAFAARHGATGDLVRAQHQESMHGIGLVEYRRPVNR
jgi:hypothetical protein